MDKTIILNELKSLILAKTGIRTITPADCKRISIEISKALNKNVSETTIKRLFGFAVVKHNFSKFTLTTIAEYAYRESHKGIGNRAYTEHYLQSFPESDTHNWKHVHRRATETTHFTLKGIKNRSGLPYEMTIGRKFAEQELEYFFNSNYSFTAFISQPGYGRTILLSHLAHLFIDQNAQTFKNSALLFTTAYNFFNKDELLVNFEDRLKAQLGIDLQENLIDYVNGNYEKSGTKLIIFLDGFSEIVLRRELKRQLFESIINFICAIEDSHAIKVVMSMRSTTWTRFYDCIRHSTFLKKKWFKGNYFIPEEVSNVPLLTEKEIALIFSKMSQNKDINSRLKSQLKFPLHIQLYYQLKETHPDFNYTTNITLLELVSSYIQDKIYQSNFYTEKILFLKKIIQLTNYGSKGSCVLKDTLINELPALENAYIELVADGILTEDRSQEELHPREYVRFVHPQIFEYFVFTELSEKHLNVDLAYFAYIVKEYQDSHLRLQLLQWAIRYVIRRGDFGSLEHIFNIGLNNCEKNYLILFIAENLDHRAKHYPETIELLKAYKLHTAIINELFTLDIIDPNYKESLHTLIRIADSEAHHQTYHALLTFIDLVSLNPQQISKRIEVLSNFNFSKWLVSPLRVTQLIYDKLMDKAADGQSFLDEVEVKIRQQSSKELNPQNAISYLLVILLNSFYGDPTKIIRLIHVISDQHCGLFVRRSSFAIFMMSIYGLFCSQTNDRKKSDQVERLLTALDQDRSRYKNTVYSSTIIKLMQAQQFKRRGDYERAFTYSYECLQVFKKNELNLQCLYAYHLIIEIFTGLNDVVKLNDYKYERICFIEDNGIASRSFTLPKIGGVN